MDGSGCVPLCLFAARAHDDVFGRDNKIGSFTGTFYGLEPATSGVTGLFHKHDDRRRLTRNRSIHADLRGFHADFVHDRADSLSGVCCPSAAQEPTRLGVRNREREQDSPPPY